MRWREIRRGRERGRGSLSRKEDGVGGWVLRERLKLESGGVVFLFVVLLLSCGAAERVQVQVQVQEQDKE